MTSLEHAVSFIAAYPHLAYPVVFLLACSESLPVLGAVIPGTIVIVALSALIPSGTLKLYPMLAAAFAGAIAGDGMGYWLGHQYGERVFALWPIKNYPASRTASESFIARHGGKSVFMARFLPGVRAFVPLVAGMSGMQPGRFYLVNILSAAIWAPSHVIPGLLAATLAGSMGRNALPLIAVVGLLALLLWAALRIVSLLVGRLLPLATSGIDVARNWSARRSDWASRIVLALVNPDKTEPPILGLLVVVLIGAGWLFFGIAEDVINGDPLVSFDQAIFELLRGFRTAALDRIIIAITELGDTPVVIAVVATVLGFLLLRRSWRTAAYFLAAVAGGSLFNSVIKATVQRARPMSDLYTGFSDFSFPSGHSTENAVLYGFIAYLVCRRLSGRLQIAVILMTVSLVAAIAFSRIYIGAHYFSDVAGGLAFASAWLTVLMIAYHSHRAASEGIGGLAFVACAALLIGGSFHIWKAHANDVKRYAVQDEVPAISLESWWNGGWQDQPANRVDLTGEVEEPFILQWAGELDDLQHQLEGQGWQVSQPWSFETASRYLGSASDTLQLPASPSLERGKIPSLILQKPASDKASSRKLIYVWRADADVYDQQRHPLWLAAMVEQTVKHPFGLPWSTSKAMTAVTDLKSLGDAELRYRHSPPTSATANEIVIGRSLTITLPIVPTDH